MLETVPGLWRKFYQALVIQPSFLACPEVVNLAWGALLCGVVSRTSCLISINLSWNLQLFLINLVGPRNEHPHAALSQRALAPDGALAASGATGSEA